MIKTWMIPGADTAFPEGGRQPQRGAKFPWKLHENEENWIGDILLCRSTTGFIDENQVSRLSDFQVRSVQLFLNHVFQLN